MPSQKRPVQEVENAPVQDKWKGFFRVAFSSRANQLESCKVLLEMHNGRTPDWLKAQAEAAAPKPWGWADTAEIDGDLLELLLE